MQCDFCNNEASMEIVMVVGEQTHRIRMCSTCYREHMEKLMNLFQGELNEKELQEQMQLALLDFIEHVQGSEFQSNDFNMTVNGENPFAELRRSQIADADAQIDADADDVDDLDGEDTALDDVIYDENGAKRSDSIEITGMDNADPYGLFSELRKRRQEVEMQRDDASEQKETTDGITPDSIVVQLKKKTLMRKRLLRKMEKALQDEDYEICATLRDRIQEISNDIVALNEKRKATYGA